MNWEEMQEQKEWLDPEIRALMDEMVPVGRVLTDIGHDTAGYEITLAIPAIDMRVKIHNDGRGGMLELSYADGLKGGQFSRPARDMEARVQEFVQERQVPRLMRDNGGWGDLIKDADNIEVNYDSAMGFIAEAWLNRRVEDKFIARHEKKGIVFRDADGELRATGWKHPLDAIVKAAGVAKVQEAVDNAIASLPAGAQVLNTNFERLGLQVNAVGEGQGVKP